MPWLILLALTAAAVFVAKKATASSSDPVYDEAHTAIGAEVGSHFVIRLPENPSTGYLWDYLPANDGALGLVDHGFVSANADPKIVSQGGDHLWKFAVNRAGPTIATFQLRGPGGGAVEKIVAFAVNQPVVGSKGASAGLSDTGASAASSDDNYAGKKDGYWVLSARGADAVRKILSPRLVEKMFDIDGEHSYLVTNIAQEPNFGRLVRDAAGSPEYALLLRKIPLDQVLGGEPLFDVDAYVVRESNLQGWLQRNATQSSLSELVRIFP